MNENLEIAEKKRKSLLPFYWLMLLMSLSLIIMCLTGLLSLGSIEDATILYQYELMAVASLAVVPFGIWFYNWQIKKADKKDITMWCTRYYSLALIRSASCALPIITGAFLYFVSGKDTSLYYAAFGVLSYLYVYPSKRELMKLLDGETDK